MKLIYSIILFLILVTPSFAQDTTFVVSVKDGVDYKFTIKKNSDGIIQSVSFFEYVGEEGIFLAERIRFSEEDFAHYIDFDDYNFDGYIDIYVHDPCMILANCHGKVYLYEDGSFKHHPGFDVMTSVSADPLTKEITSLNRSAAGSLFNNETYKWINGKLVLVKRISQDLGEVIYGHQLYVYRIEELDSNGNLITTTEEILNEPRLD